MRDKGLIWRWFKKKVKNDFQTMEVIDPNYNVVEELINSYKLRQMKDDELILKLQKENDDLRMTIIDLNTRIANTPKITPPVIKHFNTIEGLKHELEARSRKKMLEERGAD